MKLDGIVKGIIVFVNSLHNNYFNQFIEPRNWPENHTQVNSFQWIVCVCQELQMAGSIKPARVSFMLVFGYVETSQKFLG